jgi:non-homologous end joining protein Ku
LETGESTEPVLGKVLAQQNVWQREQFVLKLGSSKVPVKLYSAVQDRDVRFHILESGSKSRVKQQIVRPENHKHVGREDIRKGYEIEPGEFVVIEDQKAKKLQPKESREVQFTHFVPPLPSAASGTKGPTMSARTGKNRNTSFLLKHSAIKNVEGIARWTMRGKSYVGALLVYDKVLYPAARVTKAQVIDYYLRVSSWILPHLKYTPEHATGFEEA